MNRKVPEIRFEGFTEDWELRKFFDSIENTIDFRGKTPKKLGLDWSDNGYLALSALNVKNGFIDSKADAHYGDQNLYDKWMNGQDLHKGQVLFTTEAPMGNVAQVPDDQGYILSQRTIAFKVRAKKMTDNFLAVLLRTPKAFYDLTSLSSGGTAKGVSQKSLSHFKVIVPKELKEQQKIGSFFRGLDNLITLHQRKLENLKKSKKGFLQKMFPKNGEQVPEIRFDGFTSFWKNRKVSELFTITRGQVLATNKTVEKQTKEMPYPVYSSQTKNNGLMGYYKDYLFDTAVTWTTDGANAGTVNFREGKFYSTNVNGVLLSSEGYANKFVAEALNRIAWKYVSQVGNPKLMNNVMGEILVLLPENIEEQTQIGNFLKKLDDTIALQERQLENLKKTKQAFLQKMFI
ncbi:restriction endonuclease subunit S [Listeria aquatica]|uniref:Restriction endonuclease subunit S n=1 Tax=Listeria aquatica TaxID=1494960 RepID=A0A841ZNJ5_9LIST|nr:restriction endonuclease subunit S [Listeria aquatica]MBC1520745.1 restriction endonuclease subunit S [Listeria aquatica]